MKTAVTDLDRRTFYRAYNRICDRLFGAPSYLIAATLSPKQRAEADLRLAVHIARVRARWALATNSLVDYPRYAAHALRHRPMGSFPAELLTAKGRELFELNASTLCRQCA
jgi:hypothetical protein